MEREKNRDGEGDLGGREGKKREEGRGRKGCGRDGESIKKEGIEGGIEDGIEGGRRVEGRDVPKEKGR